MKYLKIAILIVVLGTSLWAAQEIVRDDTDGTPRTPSRLVPLWVTLDIAVASGTGTSTTYVEKIPLVWDATTKKLYASGVPLLFETVQSATYPSSIVLSSETIGLMTRLASILSSLASDAVGLKTDTTLATETIGLITALQNVFNAVASSAINTNVTLSTDSIHLIETIQRVVDSLASDAYGLKIHDMGTATLPLQASTSTIGSVSLTLSSIPSHVVYTTTVGTSTAITSLANRRWIFLTSSGTFAMTIGSTTIPAGAGEHYNYRVPDCPASWPIGITTNATSSNVDVYQGSN